MGSKGKPSFRAGAVVLAAGLACIAFAVVLWAWIQPKKDALISAAARSTAQALAKQVQVSMHAYNDSVVMKLKRDGVPIAALDAQHFGSVEGGIPLPETFIHELGRRFATAEGTSIALLSAAPINVDKNPRNATETAMLQALAKNPKVPQEHLEASGTQVTYTYAVSEVATSETCVQCHNGHPASPKRDFRVGDVMGAIVVTVRTGQELALIDSAMNTTLVMAVLCLFLLAGVVVAFQAVWMNRPLFRALTELERAADRISIGELDHAVTPSAIPQVGRIGSALDRMRVSLKAALERLEGD